MTRGGSVNRPSRRKRPDLTDLCARPTCEHEYGLHYLTHNAAIVGCAWQMDDQRDGMQRCDCEDFLIAFVERRQKT